METSPASATATDETDPATSSPTDVNDPSTPSNVGAAVGGAIGGVVILLLLAFAFVFLYRRRKRAQQQRQSEKEAAAEAAMWHATPDNAFEMTPGQNSAVLPTYLSGSEQGWAEEEGAKFGAVPYGPNTYNQYHAKNRPAPQMEPSELPSSPGGLGGSVAGGTVGKKEVVGNPEPVELPGSDVPLLTSTHSRDGSVVGGTEVSPGLSSPGTVAGAGTVSALSENGYGASPTIGAGNMGSINRVVHQEPPRSAAADSVARTRSDRTARSGLSSSSSVGQRHER